MEYRQTDIHKVMPQRELGHGPSAQVNSKSQVILK